MPYGGEISSDILPDVHETTIYVKGNDVAGSKRLLARLEQKNQVSNFRIVLRVLGGLLFFVAYATLSVFAISDILLIVGALIVALSFIRQRPRNEVGRFTYLKCPACQ